MNVKKAITIGLLTIATIGLVGCAIVLSKHKEYTPKTLDVYAESPNEITLYQTEETENFIDAEGDDESSRGFYVTVESKVTLKYVNQIQKYYVKSYLTNFYADVYPDYKTTYTIQIQREITKEQAESRIDVNFFALHNPSYSGNTIYTDILLRFKINNQVLTPDAQHTYEVIELNNVQDAQNKYEYYETTDSTLNLDTLNWNGTIPDTAIQEIYNYGYQTGYSAGYQTKGDLADGNFLDIRNMMLSVLTMPFTFINQAFNVTLWEGTTYEFNIGRFIKGLIAIASILFIIKLFTTGFSIIGNYTGNIIARSDEHKLSRSQRKLNKAKTKQIKQNKTQIKHTYVHKDE